MPAGLLGERGTVSPAGYCTIASARPIRAKFYKPQGVHKILLRTGSASGRRGPVLSSLPRRKGSAEGAGRACHLWHSVTARIPLVGTPGSLEHRGDGMADESALTADAVSSGGPGR